VSEPAGEARMHKMPDAPALPGSRTSAGKTVTYRTSHSAPGGFGGCQNLPHTYINQGRADGDRSHISSRRLARMILTRPDSLKAEHHDLLARLTAACPEMTQLAAVVGGFAALLGDA
jgi:hypothetical protein